MTQEQTFGPPWTILKLLQWTKQYFEKNGIDAARFEAELLLSHTLKMERVFLYANHDKPLEKEELGQYRQLVKRRANHEPLAYITGQRGFMSIDLKTDKRALIPRPDTETLVEAALKQLPKDTEGQILDVGTGTGAIALSILHERPNLRATAVDISEEALALATENAEALELTERITMHTSDLLSAVEGTFDMILSNPPYIGESEKSDMAANVLDHEPHLALFAGDDGLDIIRRLIPQTMDHLAEGGTFMCEIGYQQGPDVAALFKQGGFQDVEVIQDINRKDRVVSGKKP